MGSSVSVLSPCTEAHNEFKELYNNKKAMNKLFLEIASFGHDDPKDHPVDEAVRHLDIKDKICLSEILLFINRDGNPIFAKNLTKSVIAIKEAFKFAIGYKAGKDYSTHEMVKKEFRKMVPALLLFTELYNIFCTCDTNIDDDRIFPAEFTRARNLLHKIDGVTVSDISEEEWDNEFKKIDSNKNGYITFNEFTKYCLAKIVTPSFYMNEICKRVDDEGDIIDAMGSQVVHAALLHTMSSLTHKSLLELEQNSPSVQKAEVSTQETLPEVITEAETDATKTNTDSDRTEPNTATTTSSTITSSVSVPDQDTEAPQVSSSVAQLTRAASLQCVTQVIEKSVSSIERTEPNTATTTSTTTTASVSVPDQDTEAPQVSSSVAQLTRAASLQCVTQVIEKSVSSVENAHNSSLV